MSTSVRPYQVLHHAFPFIMLDAVYEVEPGTSGKGRKNITSDEFLVRDAHYPACLLIEAAAQLSGIVSGREQGGFLAGMKNIVFRKLVSAGDMVEFRSIQNGTFGGLYSFQVQAFCGGEPVMEGELYLALA